MPGASMSPSVTNSSAPSVDGGSLARASVCLPAWEIEEDLFRLRLSAAHYWAIYGFCEPIKDTHFKTFYVSDSGQI